MTAGLTIRLSGEHTPNIAATGDTRKKSWPRMNGRIKYVEIEMKDAYASLRAD